jgi:hypothetical protein
MKKLLFAVLFSSILAAAQTRGPDNPWKAVDDAMGRPGQDQPDGSHKFSMPRGDLKVTADGVELKPGFALGSWAAFLKMGNQIEVMGDLVLIESEIGPVMQKLIDSGIEISALHNHIIRETPHIMYMHIDGKGDAVKLGTAIHDALALTKTPPPTPAPASPAEISFDTKQVDTILGRSGRNNNGVYQFAISRAEKIMEGGWSYRARWV